MYGNHSNRLDAFILNCFTPWHSPTGGILAQDFFRSNFLSWAFHGLDIHPTKKHVTEPSIIRTINQILERKNKVVIYPEGGSRWLGEPDPWIPATAKIFARSGLDVYPVITRGSYATWPRWADYPRPGRIHIHIGDPIVLPKRTPVEDAIQAYREACFIDESTPIPELAPKRAYKPASGIQRVLYRDPVSGRQDGLFTPDGRTVTNHDGSLQLEVRPDSMLVDKSTNEVNTIKHWYDRISSLPLEPSRDGVYLKNQVDLFEELEFPNIEPLGVATLALFKDHVSIRTGSDHRVIPFDDIRTVQIERNYKLQIFGDAMLQCDFVHGGSPLLWKDAITKLMGDQGGVA